MPPTRTIVLLLSLVLCVGACGATAPSPEQQTATAPLQPVFAENKTAAATHPTAPAGIDPQATPDPATLPFIHENAVIVLPIGLKLYESQTETESGIKHVLYQKTGANVNRVERGEWAVVTLARGPVDSAYVRMADLHQDGEHKGELVTPPASWLGTKITNASGADVNVRADASTANDPVMMMGANTSAIQIGQQEQPDGTWFQVVFEEGTTGWVRADAVAAP